MTPISPNLIRIGGGVLAAGAGIGVVALAAKLSSGPEASDRRQLVSGILAGVGGAAVVGAVLARSTSAFGPLLGAGIGLAGAGIVDAIRAGGGTVAGEMKIPSRLDSLKPGDLLPDGVQGAPPNVYRQGNEIRFDSVIGNQGAAPLQLALRFNEKAGTSRTTQVILNEDGTATERDMQGGLRKDERRDHAHLHFDDFSFFQMYKADGNGRPDIAAGEITGGAKQSFYITDIQGFAVPANNRAAADKLALKGKVDRGIVEADAVQGISVGMADVYGAGLDGQSLHVGDIAPGRYVLRESFDPRDEVLEQDERNNVADTLIEIDADGKLTKLNSVLAPPSDYQTLADGRIVIPQIVESLERAGTGHHATVDPPTLDTEGDYDSGALRGADTPAGFGPQVR